MILLCVVAAAQAHHSTTIFDNSKTATVTGMVVKLEWTNPHVFVWVDVANANEPGREDLYAFETASPNVLESAGWNRTILRAGDTITVEYAPRRDGRNGGLWILGRRADGTVLTSRDRSAVRDRPPTRAGAQAASAPCPRAEVVEVMPKASGETRPVIYQNGTIHVSAPLSTLADIVAINFVPPRAISLAFTPQVGERMERMTARPAFPLAFVVDDEALLSVVLEGGFGIGRDGLKISVDGNDERIERVYDALSRCVALRNAR
jgi:hypothetical protein